MFILSREVINSGGMSFNKIKPVYREMLMKLVMTMSKDEIFTRYHLKLHIPILGLVLKIEIGNCSWNMAGARVCTVVGARFGYLAKDSVAACP